MFAALAVPNFPLYLAGQAVSLTGTWMQVVAQSWLVLQLTGSGVLLGLVAAAQFLPVLLLGPYGGLVADRAGKRRLLLGTQSVLGVLALVLGLLTVTHVVRLWMVFVLAVALRQGLRYVRGAPGLLVPHRHRHHQRPAGQLRVVMLAQREPQHPA